MWTVFNAIHILARTLNSYINKAEEILDAVSASSFNTDACSGSLLILKTKADSCLYDKFATQNNTGLLRLSKVLLLQTSVITRSGRDCMAMMSWCSVQHDTTEVQ